MPWFKRTNAIKSGSAASMRCTIASSVSGSTVSSIGASYSGIRLASSERVDGRSLNVLGLSGYGTSSNLSACEGLCVSDGDSAILPSVSLAAVAAAMDTTASTGAVADSGADANAVAADAAAAMSVARVIEDSGAELFFAFFD